MTFQHRKMWNAHVDHWIEKEIDPLALKKRMYR